ncbi:MAG TPA: hypothetical protein VES42_23725 [Pilimelia sp.]|nr:hypothetical protein [Pilimelia sp.]
MADKEARPRRWPPGGVDPSALFVAYEAPRGLLDATSPREVVDEVFDFVEALGGRVTPARLGQPDTQPLDLSFGVDEPMLAATDPLGIPRLHLTLLLPTFLEDARGVIMQMRHTTRLRDEASCDHLTRLLSRRALDREVYRLRHGDAVAAITLDEPAWRPVQVDTAADEQLLVAFGPLLCDHLRPANLVARFDRTTLVVAALEEGPGLLAQRLDRLRRAWPLVRPQPVTFSAAVVAVDIPGSRALGEACQALSAARRAGPGRTVVTQ